MNNLTFEIYAVDPTNKNHKALIGMCFNLGLAKSWASETITIDDMLIVNKNTKAQWYYNKKERKWN